MEATRKCMRLAGTLWRRAFFEGMRHVLRSTREKYQELHKESNAEQDAQDEGSKKEQGKSLLEKLAETIEYAGKEWKKSAQRTRDYLAKLAKWTEADLNRQITLY